MRRSQPQRSRVVLCVYLCVVPVTSFLSPLSYCCNARSSAATRLRVAKVEGPGAALPVPTSAGGTPDVLQRGGTCTVPAEEGRATQNEAELAVVRLLRGREVVIRKAQSRDLWQVADLRLNVFATYHPDIRHRFRDRTHSLIVGRQKRGAVCLVAGIGPSAAEGGEMEVVASCECSLEEFSGTSLAMDGKTSRRRWYLTEMAVHEDWRRMGVGRELLALADEAARRENVQEIFLHVNELNHGAIALYKSAGYRVPTQTPVFTTFTAALGLADGFIGKRHVLMHRDVSNAEPAELAADTATRAGGEKAAAAAIASYKVAEMRAAISARAVVEGGALCASAGAAPRRTTSSSSAEAEKVAAAPAAQNAAAAAA